MSDPTPEEMAAARDYMGTSANPDMGALVDALKAARTNAYATGLLVGATQTKAPTLTELPDFTVPADWTSYWDSWTPGNTPAADELSGGGLADLLSDDSVTIKGITGSMLDDLGNLLAQGVANGDSVNSIADSLMGYLGDPARALMIARTETARAVTVGSLSSYRDAGVEKVAWLLSPDACDECESEAADSPYNLGDEPDLPEHPNCRCSLSPVDSGSGSSDDLSSDDGE